jgi:hypothetical protein
VDSNRHKNQKGAGQEKDQEDALRMLRKKLRCRLSQTLSQTIKNLPTKSMNRPARNPRGCGKFAKDTCDLSRASFKYDPSATFEAF